MHLPDGVSYHWRRRDDWKGLITQGGEGLIRINNNLGYTIEDRLSKEAVVPFLKGDWKEFDRRFQLRSLGLNDNPGLVYSRAEHKGNPRLPNIMVVPNLFTERGLGQEPLMVFGCIVGHFRPNRPPAYWVQEVYEFQSYGLAVLDRKQGEIELWVAQDGDKVAVPNGCHMTLYNLGGLDDPLITLDFANPDRSPTDNMAFVGQYGPVLLAYYDDSEVTFQLNQLYIDNLAHEAGVRLSAPFDDPKDRQVKIPLGARLKLGRHLYEQLTRNPDVIYQFARLGIRVRPASPEAVLEPFREKGIQRDLRICFAAPLVKATRPGTIVYRYFFPKSNGGRPGKPRHNIAFEEQKRRPNFSFALKRLKRPLTILVEGAGEWVQKEYRPVFKALAQRSYGSFYNLSVIYADDTRWTDGNPPGFAQNPKPSWELYLDKSRERDLDIYQNLAHVDVVFIVTPDFTHSEIARSWLDRAPLILVEKPFDSNLDNVDSLLRAWGLSRGGTRILGLDHYRFYAMPLRDLLPSVVDHLGGALETAIFYITEGSAIKKEHIRTLQHGLTLDLLPHFFALLLFFGDLETVDAVSAIKAGQYDPPPPDFKKETASFTISVFEDYSGNEYPVTCKVVAGKGFSKGAKYLEITGINGNAIRIDFSKIVLDELVESVSRRITEAAMETVVRHLEENLPAAVSDQIDNVLGMGKLVEMVLQTMAKVKLVEMVWQIIANVAVEAIVDYLKTGLPEPISKEIDAVLEVGDLVGMVLRAFGRPDDMVAAAVTTIVDHLKKKLPTLIAEQIDYVLGTDKLGEMVLQTITKIAVETVVDHLGQESPDPTHGRVDGVPGMDKPVEIVSQAITEVAVETVVDYLKKKLPDPIPEQIDAVLKTKGHILFLQNTALNNTLLVNDPYNPKRQLHIREDLGRTPIDRERYKRLIKDLLDGGKGDGFDGAISLTEARQVMVALERFWRAVQGDRPNWKPYPLGGPDPIQWA